MVTPSESAASFALSILRESASPSESFVFSPFALGSSLAILHDAVEGKAKEELKELLLPGFNGEEEVSATYSTQTQGEPSNKKVQIGSAIRLYVDAAAAGDVDKDLQESIQQTYAADVVPVNFKNTLETVEDANAFVSERTNDEITEMLGGSDLKEVSSSLLISAAYIKGQWKASFEKENTKKEVFHGAKGDREIEFMSTCELHCAFNMSYADCEVLSLAYADLSYRCVFILPKPDVPLDEFRRKLTGSDLHLLMTDTLCGKVNVTVPKFSLSADVDGVRALSRLGDDAQVGELTRIGCRTINAIKHKALIEIGEEGVATSVVSMNKFNRCLPKIPPPTQNFRADRPFIFGVIRDEHVLFLGQFC